MKELAKSIVRKFLSKKGFAVIRVGDKKGDQPGFQYIAAGQIVSAAEREGLSVCDYVENLWDQQGGTQRVIDRIASCGVFEVENPVVLEIGPGTGRYLEKILTKRKPARYEIYEVARDWAEWLQSRYPVVVHEADGASLKQTAADSVNLLHAHGVFVQLPFLVTYRYWMEMWRVVRNNGWVVFDIYSEDCMDEPTVEKWLVSEHNYPYFLSRNYVVSLFERHGFSLKEAFTNKHGEGRSEYLVFVRDKVESSPAIGTLLPDPLRSMPPFSLATLDLFGLPDRLQCLGEFFPHSASVCGSLLG